MANDMYFEYGYEEINYLKKKDPILGKAIDEIGHVYREIIPDMFMAMINSIIGQQITTKAQETIWQRFQKEFSPITPEHIGSLPAETIQKCGISMRKATYILEISKSILDGSLDLIALQTMSDEQVKKRLVKIKGVGVWTAEMLMIFSMQRKDILSWGDIAILRGLRMLHQHNEITKELFQEYKQKYSPYGTIASLYLWKISHGACEGLEDPALKQDPIKKTSKTKPVEKSTGKYKLLDEAGNHYYSKQPGLIGGHRRSKIYGQLDCKSANRAIAKGGYVKYRVFFKDEKTAIKAGYRPCAKCMPKKYAEWKKSQ